MTTRAIRVFLNASLELIRFYVFSSMVGTIYTNKKQNIILFLQLKHWGLKNKTIEYRNLI